MIVISHQFLGIEKFDRILVLRNGQIVEAGTHGDLLERNGYYCDLLGAAGRLPADRQR